MKLSLLLLLGVLLPCAVSHMPTVYEFCSYIVSNGNISQGQATCDPSQCQGRPGKLGRTGPRGSPGFRGEKGERGTSEHLEGKVQNLGASLDTLIRRLISVESIEEAVCFMGMKNRKIPDSAITSSSDHDNNHASRLGRLDNMIGVGAWCAGALRIGEWIQVDFKKPMLIGGIVTQGRPHAYNQWVKTYKVSCGIALNEMANIMQEGADQIFVANSDMGTKVYNKFSQAQTCRYIRIYPQTWNNYMSMRVEFIDGSCFKYF